MFERPLGIVLTAVYAALNAVLALLVAFIGLIGSAVAPPAAAGWVGLLSVAALGLGVISAAVAYGLWTRQSWAPKLTLYTSWASIAFGVVALVNDQSPGNVALQLLGIGLSAVIIVYIRRPEIVALFARSPDGQGEN